MQHLTLDFTRPAPRYSVAMMWGLLLCFGLVTIFFVVQQQQLSNEINRIHQKNLAAQETNRPVKINPDVAFQLSAVQKTQYALNIPWEKMLTALEQAQLENLKVQLLSVQPKPEKAEILISGVVLSFDELAKYMNSLRLQPGLGDVVLLSQHWEQNVDSDNIVTQDQLMFNLSVVWQLR